MSRGIAVITFPGSNGDHDALDAFGTVSACRPSWWITGRPI